MNTGCLINSPIGYSDNIKPESIVKDRNTSDSRSTGDFRRLDDAFPAHCYTLSAFQFTETSFVLVGRIYRTIQTEAVLFPTRTKEFESLFFAADTLPHDSR